MNIKNVLNTSFVDKLQYAHCGMNKHILVILKAVASALMVLFIL